MALWSDGRERPDWYVGTSLQEGIREYCESFSNAEIERLRVENQGMRESLATRQAPRHKAASA